MGFRKGTGFTNLNKIMQANRGSRLGTAVSGGITGQVQNVQSGIQTAQQKFEEEAQKKRLDTEEAKKQREQILGRFDVPQPGQPAPQSGGTGVIPQPTQAQPTQPQNTAVNQPGQAPGPVQAPTTPASKSPVTDEEIKEFTRFRTGTYTGPSQLDEAGLLTSQAQQAESLGQLARSQGGRQELLRQFVGGRDYTAGQRSLDETILGQDPSVNLGAAARQTRGALEKVQQANRLASSKAEEYRQRAKIFGEETMGLIGEKKAPISTSLDERVKQAQEAEKVRQENLKSIQDVLSGKNTQLAGLDNFTRLALGLDTAKELGYLKDQDVGFLLGQGDQIGLLQRGANLGLDINALLQERIKDVAAQNLSRTGVASEEDIARLNALDRLAGRQGADLEFREGQGRFKAGEVGFDLGSLEDYITRAEKQKAASDKAYADKLAAEQARYLNQAKAYGMNALGNAQNVLGNIIGSDTGTAAGAGIAGTAGAISLANLGTALAGGGGSAIGLGSAGYAALPAAVGFDILTGKDTTAQTANMAAQTGLSGAGAQAQASNALMEGLLKLNIGGKSLADNEAGKRILELIKLKSELENKAIGEGSKAASEISGEVGKLTRTALNDPRRLLNFMNTGGSSVFNPTASRIAGNILGKTGSDLIKSGGLSAVRSVGSSAKKAFKKLKKRFSDEDLKENIDYSDKDVQAFMDRLKPASYDYKDEVKDSPLASKDRQIGIMAQDLEKSKLGKEAVKNTEMGKIVDYKDLEPKVLASLAALNKRLKKLEGKE